MDSKTIEMLANKRGYSSPLRYRIAIYVPSTVNVNRKTNTTKYVNNTLQGLSRLFGGATAIKAAGGWITSYNELVTEDITIVYAYSDTTSFTEEAINEVISYCEYMKKELKQEAITLELNNELYFI